MILLQVIAMIGAAALVTGYILHLMCKCEDQKAEEEAALYDAS